MPNQNTVKTYTAGDLLDAHSLAHEQLSDVHALLRSMDHELKATREYLNKAYNVPESCLVNLKRLLAITSSITVEMADHNNFIVSQYEEELKSNEGQS